MNELDFMNRLEASLMHGMASVPLLALEPASARYRIAPTKVGRRPLPRLTVAIGAIGLAVFTGLVGAAASGTTMSAALYRVVVLVEQISTPGESVQGTPSPEPVLRPAGGSEPQAIGQGSGDGDRASQPSESPAAASTEAQAPPPTEAPLADQLEDTSPSRSPDPLDSPASTLETNKAIPVATG